MSTRDKKNGTQNGDRHINIKAAYQLNRKEKTHKRVRKSQNSLFGTDMATIGGYCVCVCELKDVIIA